MFKLLLSYFGLIASGVLFIVAFTYQFISGYRSWRTIAMWGLALTGYGSYIMLDPTSAEALGAGWGALGSGVFLLLVAFFTGCITETPRAEKAAQESQ